MYNALKKVLKNHDCPVMNRVKFSFPQFHVMIGVRCRVIQGHQDLIAKTQDL